MWNVEKVCVGPELRNWPGHCLGFFLNFAKVLPDVTFVIFSEIKILFWISRYSSLAYIPQLPLIRWNDYIHYLCSWHMHIYCYKGKSHDLEANCFSLCGNIQVWGIISLFTDGLPHSYISGATKGRFLWFPVSHWPISWVANHVSLLQQDAPLIPVTRLAQITTPGHMCFLCR